MHPPSVSPRLPFAPVHHCWSCGAAIEPLQAAGQGGVCDRFQCRAAWAQRHRQAEADAERLRHEAAGDALRGAGVDPDLASWSLTPANPGTVVPLAAERREKFLRHLRRVVGEAAGDTRATTRPQPPTTGDEARFDPPGPEEQQALEAGCATCRGWCCRRGGTHAFLESGRIRRLLEERPTLSESDVVELYASHLGDDHLEGGCVFQGDRGCGLPRELRGDTCNRYLCPDLGEARRRWRSEGRPEAHHHFVALTRAGGSAPRIRTIEAPDV